MIYMFYAANSVVLGRVAWLNFFGRPESTSRLEASQVDANKIRKTIGAMPGSQRSQPSSQAAKPSRAELTPAGQGRWTVWTAVTGVRRAVGLGGAGLRAMASPRARPGCGGAVTPSAVMPASRR